MPDKTFFSFSGGNGEILANKSSFMTSLSFSDRSIFQRSVSWSRKSFIGWGLGGLWIHDRPTAYSDFIFFRSSGNSKFSLTRAKRRRWSCTSTYTQVWRRWVFCMLHMEHLEKLSLERSLIHGCPTMLAMHYCPCIRCAKLFQRNTFRLNLMLIDFLTPT